MNLWGFTLISVKFIEEEYSRMTNLWSGPWEVLHVGFALDSPQQVFNLCICFPLPVKCVNSFQPHLCWWGGKLFGRRISFCSFENFLAQQEADFMWRFGDTSVIQVMRSCCYFWFKSVFKIEWCFWASTFLNSSQSQFQTWTQSFSLSLAIPTLPVSLLHSVRILTRESAPSVIRARAFLQG